MQTFLKTHLWQIILITLAISLGAGWYYHTRIQGAATIATDTGNAQADFQADLTSTLDLQRGTGGPTFTRADGADRRATVTDFEGLIRPVKAGEARFQGARRVENLVTYSEAFDNAAWAKIYNITATANAATAPDGTQTADQLALGNVNSHVYRHLTTTGASRTYVWSVWLRAESGTFDLKLWRTNASVWSSAAVTNAITLNTTWKRYSLVFTTGSTDSNSDVGFGYEGKTPYRLPATGNIYAWGAQLEEVTGQANQNPSEYVSVGVKTAAPYHGANVDGVKYFTTQNGNTVASNVVTEAAGSAISDSTLKGYLAEGSRTNLLTYSEQFDNVAWNKATVTISADGATSPGGNLTADKIVEDVGNNNHQVYQGKVLTANSHTYTIYLKAAERNWAVVRLDAGSPKYTWVNLSTGVFGTIDPFYTASSIVALPNGWYRVSLTATATAATWYGVVQPTTGNNVAVYTGDGTSGLYIWGAQIEQASFASSYIPTTSASVTRASDSLSYPGSNVLGTQGSVSLTVQLNGLFPSTDSVNNGILDFRSSPPRYVFTRNRSSTYINTSDGTNVISSGATINDLGSHILGLKWSSSTSMKQFVDGSGAGTSNFDGDFDVNGVYVGIQNAAGNSQTYGTIKNVKIWKQAMSDTFLTNLTAGNDGVEKQTTVNVASGNNLVGHWAFDEASGTSAGDDSGNRNTGTLTNGPTWTTGARGGAVSFDGVNDYVTGSQTGFATGTSARSIGGWINMTNTATVKVPFAYGSCGTGNDGKAFGVYLDASETLNFWGCGTSDFSTGTTVSTGTWHHIMVTYDGTSVRVYVDGSQVGSTTARTLGVGTTAWVVGSDGTLDTADYPFTGQIDDVRVYSRALSASEVRSLYQVNATMVNSSQNSQLTNGLVGLWSFNGYDMAGTTAYDRSGSGNNGTLTSGPTPASGKVGQALNFDGTNDYINAGSASSLDVAAGNFSLCAWFKTTGTEEDIIGNGGFLLMSYLTKLRGHVWTTTSSNTIDSVAVVNDGNWHFGCQTVDSTKIYLYVDGSLDNSQNLVGTKTSNFNAVGIGCRQGSGGCVSSLFGGTLDEVRIYNRALSATEVSQLYNLGR